MTKTKRDKLIQRALRKTYYLFSIETTFYQTKIEQTSIWIQHFRTDEKHRKMEFSEFSDCQS